MEKVIEKLKGLNSKNKKILLVGNRPFTEKIGKTIDSYDYVIRFNLNPYFINIGKLDKEYYGSKTDMIMINRFTESLFYIKGKPITNFSNEDITKYKKYVRNCGKDIVTITNLSKLKFLGYYFKSIIDYCDATTCVLKCFKKLYNFDDLNDDPKFVLTMGLYTICFFLLNKIKFDIVGFNLTDQSYERSYYACYEEKRKKKYPNSLEKLKSHSTGFEVDLLNRLYKLNLFNVLDYPSDEFILKKNGCIKFNLDKHKLISFEELKNKNTLLNKIKIEPFFKKFTNSIYHINNSVISNYSGFFKNEKSISLDEYERAIVFALVQDKTIFEYIPESHYNNDFYNKVSLILNKGDIIAYDARLQRNFKTDLELLVISYTVPSRLAKYNKFINDFLLNSVQKFLIDTIDLDNETPICIFNQEIKKDELAKKKLTKKKLEVNNLDINKINNKGLDNINRELENVRKEEDDKLKKIKEKTEDNKRKKLLKEQMNKEKELRNKMFKSKRRKKDHKSAVLETEVKNNKHMKINTKKNTTSLSLETKGENNKPLIKQRIKKIIIKRRNKKQIKE